MTTADPRPIVRRDHAILAAVYAAALAAAVLAGWLAREWHPLAMLAFADVVGTLVVFVASVRFDNSSMYDPYWSVAPLPLAAYWLLADHGADGLWLRRLLVIALVVAWGGRLTFNFLRGWRGLRHEDWRYRDLRYRAGAAYWGVSLLGIHLLPTALVFLGCLALLPALLGDRPAGWLDAVAIGVGVIGFTLEWRADRDLRAFVEAPREGDRRVLDQGLWAWSRHPNYLGEILIWWGLWLFGLAADPWSWWTVIGPVAITALFLTVSLPMIERRMAIRYPGWEAYRARVPRLVPRPWRR